MKYKAAYSPITFEEIVMVMIMLVNGPSIIHHKQSTVVRTISKSKAQ